MAQTLESDKQTPNVRSSPKPKRYALGKYVGSRIHILQNRVLSARKDSAVIATLARLRYAVGTEPMGTDPIVWDTIYDGFPEALVGKTDTLTTSEQAAYAAFTLYALHQQAKDTPMHVVGEGLGKAVRKLASPQDAEDREKPVMRRFSALTTAQTPTEILHHLRGIIQQFRSENIPIDYGRLAEDLADLQLPWRANSVRLRWARDLHRNKFRNNLEEN